MKYIGVMNVIGLTVALAVAWLAVAGTVHTQRSNPIITTTITEGASEMMTLADGSQAVRDFRGAIIPVAEYHRIASLGIQSDALLAELCEPERIICSCFWSTGPWVHRLGARPRLKSLEDLEAVIALKPDLVLISTFGGELERVQRLRDAGLTVCDLGPQGGVQSMIANAQLIGAVLNSAQRARYFTTAFMRRFQHVAASLPQSTPRYSAVYVQCIGDALFGGTRGTSYHDVLEAAGLRDVAAAQFSGWPQYGIEQLISLNPERIVTLRGSAEIVRRLPGAEALRAVRDPHGIIELDDALLQCPGPVMLDAAEALHEAVYGTVSDVRSSH